MSALPQPRPYSSPPSLQPSGQDHPPAIRPPGHHALTPAVSPPEANDVSVPCEAPRRAADRCHRTPCKFLRTPRGCKDGLHCVFCHTCAWKHAMRRRGPRPAWTEANAATRLEAHLRRTTAAANAAEVVLQGVGERELQPFMPEHSHSDGSTNNSFMPGGLGASHWWSAPQAWRRPSTSSDVAVATASPEQPVAAISPTDVLAHAANQAELQVSGNPPKPEDGEWSASRRPASFDGASSTDAPARLPRTIDAGVDSFASQRARRGLHNRKLHVVDR